MKQQEIQVFIEGVKHYFKKESNIEASVGTPYLVDSKDSPALSYTGIIGISGERKGCVYFTAPSVMLRHLLVSMGESVQSDHYISDLTGEVANTISGNAKKSFGSQFMISVPIVVKGVPDQLQLPKDIDVYVVPMSWKSYDANLVVCLE
ncbi:chemotaxis protein CheX [Marinicellulosiphila megalodicopiae]|uniref:chemotaxis protein CheX n=1 Tax=Marinicellulosiphila megalodicopiae TaxID=2724896 RepID=UPI003BAFFFC9